MKKGEIVPKEEQEKLELEAQEHDTKLTTALNSLDKSIFSVGCELAIMRDRHLYRFIKDPATNGDDRGCFKDWRDYARFKLGKMSTAKMYELISAHTLTCGINAIPTEEVVELGVKKAAQIARLPEKKRTAQLVQQAKHQTVREVTSYVNRALDEEKPESEKKVKLVPLTIGLPNETIDLIDQVEKDGMFLEAVRDGDKTVSLRAKLWHFVWNEFLQNHQEELAQAAEYREVYLADQNNKGRTDDSERSVIH